MASIWKLFTLGTVNLLLRAASVDEDVFYFQFCHQARQKGWLWWCSSTPTGMRGISYCGISKDIFLPKNAVGIEMDFLSEETDPFPRPGCVPSYVRAICWLQIEEKLTQFWPLGMCKAPFITTPVLSQSNLACLAPVPTLLSLQWPFFVQAHSVLLLRIAPHCCSCLFFPWFLFLMPLGL